MIVDSLLRKIALGALALVAVSSFTAQAAVPRTPLPVVERILDDGSQGFFTQGGAPIHPACIDMYQKPFSVGSAKADEWTSREHREVMVATGTTDHATVYWDVTPENNFDWVRDNYIADGVDVVLAVILNGEITGVGRSELSELGDQVLGNLDLIISGEKYDAPLSATIQKIVEIGECVIIRAMYEADGDWFQWGMGAFGNSCSLYQQAWMHIVNMFREANAPVLFELNLNRRDHRGEVIAEWDCYYPGPKNLHFLALSSYCRVGTNPATRGQEPRSYAEEFAPAYRAIEEKTNGLIPINVAETSTSVDCGPRLPWFEAQHKSFREQFPLVRWVTYYYGTVPEGLASNDKPIIWGPVDAVEAAQFAALNQELRETMLGESDRTEVVPTQNGQPSLKQLRWKAEGSLFVDLSQTLVAVDNEALNPVSGNEFGRVGTFFTSRLTQTLRAEIADGVEVGPRFFTGLDLSDEPDMWWTQRWQNGAAIDACADAVFALWGDVCAFVEGRHILYLADAPGRYDQGFGGQEGELQARVGVRFDFGWNLFD